MNPSDLLVCVALNSPFVTVTGQNEIPPQVQRLIGGFNDHHHPLFWLRWVPTVLLGGYFIQRYVVALVHQPKFTKQDIVYQEWFASGGSLKNFLTKMGGASNCLRLVVTKDVLWVTSWFPVSFFAIAFDLEHVIPLRNVRSIESKKTLGVQSLLLTYADDRSVSHALRLFPRNTQAFLDALKTNSAWSEGALIVNVVTQEPTPTLGVALKKYWPHLLAVGLFPTVFFLGAGDFHLPFGMFIPLFFAVMIYGTWPSITKRIPFTYQFVLGAVWLAGGTFAGLFMVTIHALFGPLHR